MGALRRGGRAVAPDDGHGRSWTEPRPPVGPARFDDDELDVDVAWVAMGVEVFNDDVEILAEVEEWLQLAAADVAGPTGVEEPPELRVSRLGGTPDPAEAVDPAEGVDPVEAVNPVDSADRGLERPSRPTRRTERNPQLRLAPTSSDAWQRAESEPTVPHLSVVPDDAPRKLPAAPRTTRPPLSRATRSVRSGTGARRRGQRNSGGAER